MRRTLLSVGVSAGASLRERKSLGDFPNPPVSLPKSGGKPEKRLALRQVFFLVCPPGLEPGPGASEALMVSNSTTGTFFGTSGTISPFGKPFSFFSIYFTLFRFIFASVYAIIFLNFSKNFSPARLLRIFSCIHRLKNS